MIRIRRHVKVLISIVLGLTGILMLFASTAWFLWQSSILAEEKQVGMLAQAFATRVEEIITGSIEMLDDMNSAEESRCSREHLQRMNEAAMVYPFVKAIGYWRAEERQCGVGYIQVMELRPPRADRIYDSGVIAWWPSEHTEVGGIRLFLMRFGDHDIAIDPGLLLAEGQLRDRQAALWVEGLFFASQPKGAKLPAPDTIPMGLTLDPDNNRALFRTSLGTVLPIEIVASEPLRRVWGRYLPTIAFTAGIGLVLISAWVYMVYRYSRYRFSLSSELRDAIANERIRVEYQPIVDLSSGECVGAEALARWVREDGEVIGPDTFVPIAEEAGLVSEITREVLQLVLRELDSVLKGPAALSIAINLAPEDLRGVRFEQELADNLARAGVSPSAIKLEITERALINSDESRDLIRTLRERGHAVAVDDFGTGYSSLSYLQSFALDTLKIDKAFVDAIEKQAVTSNVIGPIIEMAKALGLDIIAEGIENAHQAEWLRDKGVKYGQGYLFSKPVSARAFELFCLEHGSPNKH